MSVRCRSCSFDSLVEVLDLGPLPLAGDFRPLGETNPLYPLAIDLCRRCGLLQVRELVPADVLFHAAYSYSSSTVPALVAHFEEYARSRPVGSDRKRLLEVGCNDGIFLKPLRAAGYQTVGIDASENVALMARAQGIDVHVGFFGAEMAARLKQQYGLFDVVTCSNVFAHNPDIEQFVTAVLEVLSDRGEFWIEVHSGHALHDGLQWDCFYHEHCFYWTIHALAFCLARYGFGLLQYMFTPMHGGSIRAVFRRGAQSQTITEVPLTEEDWAVFGRDSRRSRARIQDAVSSLPIRYAYGAAGRAVTLINWTGIAHALEFVVDGSPLRYGKAIPNTKVPVISETDFFGRGAVGDWCFITAHNYRADIRRKVTSAFPGVEFKFVTPLPNVCIE